MRRAHTIGKAKLLEKCRKCGREFKLPHNRSKHEVRCIQIRHSNTHNERELVLNIWDSLLGEEYRANEEIIK